MTYQSPIQKMMEQSEIDEIIGIPDENWNDISGIGAEIAIADKSTLEELIAGMTWIDRMYLLNEFKQHQKLYITISAMKDDTVSMLLNTRKYDDIAIALTEEEMIAVRKKLVDKFNQQYQMVLNQPVTLKICILHLQEINTEYRKAMVENALLYAPIQIENEIKISLRIEDTLTLEELARRMENEVTVLAKLRFDANKPIDFIVCSKKDKSLFLEVDDSSPEFYSQYSLDDERILCHYQIALSGMEQQILSKRLKSVINAKGGFYHE